MSEEKEAQQRLVANKLATGKAVEHIFEETHARYTMKLSIMPDPLTIEEWSKKMSDGLLAVGKATNHEEQLGKLKELAGDIVGTVIDLYRSKMYKSLDIKPLETSDKT